MKFPDESEFESLAAGWQSLSSLSNIFDGCLLAIDSIIFKIPCPQPHEVPNPIKYFCRKCYFGINAQLACGPDLRFRWADVRCAGSTHHQLAYTVSGLDDMLKRRPLKHYLVGDNGYIPHEYLLVPYKGKFIRRIDPYKESFNFLLSQLRIHVERAFGMLNARWGILWKPITTSFAGTLAILTSCFRLHNFCIESSHRIENSSSLDIYRWLMSMEDILMILRFRISSPQILPAQLVIHYVSDVKLW